MKSPKRCSIILFIVFMFYTIPRSKITYNSQYSGYTWTFSFSAIEYSITYSSMTKDYIELHFTLKDNNSDKPPLYFKPNKAFKQLEYKNTIYDQLKYDRYFGEIQYNNNDFNLKCYFKKPQKKERKIDIDMYEAVNTLFLPHMKLLHCFEITLR